MHGKVVEMQQSSKEGVNCDKMFYSRVWWKDFFHNWNIQGDE